MSVIVIGKMQADPANLQKLWKDREADFKAVQKEAKAAGAITTGGDSETDSSRSSTSGPTRRRSTSSSRRTRRFRR